MNALQKSDAQTGRVHRDDEDSFCRHCGRDNGGHENEPCSDDCPWEMARNAAPELLKAAATLLATVELLTFTRKTAATRALPQHMTDLRAAIARATGAAA